MKWIKAIVISPSGCRWRLERVIGEGKASLKLTQLHSFLVDVFLKFEMKGKQREELQSMQCWKMEIRSLFLGTFQ